MCIDVFGGGVCSVFVLIELCIDVLGGGVFSVLVLIDLCIDVFGGGVCSVFVDRAISEFYHVCACVEY